MGAFRRLYTTSPLVNDLGQCFRVLIQTDLVGLKTIVCGVHNQDLAKSLNLSVCSRTCSRGTKVVLDLSRSGAIKRWTLWDNQGGDRSRYPRATACLIVNAQSRSSRNPAGFTESLQIIVVGLREQMRGLLLLSSQVCCLRIHWS